MEEFERVGLNELQTAENIEKCQLSLDRIKEIIEERIAKIVENSKIYLENLKNEELDNIDENQNNCNFSKESLDYVFKMKNNILKNREMINEAEKLRDEEFEYKEKKLSGEFQRSHNRYRFPYYLPSKPTERQYICLDSKLGK